MPSGLSTSQLRELGLKSTGQYVWRGPVELYGIFVELTQTAFSEHGFSKRRWNPDEKKSDIYIAPDYLWDDVHVEKRPAVIVSLGELACQPYDGIMGGGKVGIDIQGEHGVEHHYCDVKTGSVIWRVVAESRGEALSISGEIFRYFNVFQDAIRGDLCFTSFQVRQLNPLNVVKEARERLQGDVSASFSYEDSWTLVEDAPKAKIDIDAHVDGM